MVDPPPDAPSGTGGPFPSGTPRAPGAWATAPLPPPHTAPVAPYAGWSPYAPPPYAPSPYAPSPYAPPTVPAPYPGRPAPRIRRVRLPYQGPPRYGPTHPNWGFPPIVRRRAEPEPEPQLRPRGLVAAAVVVAAAGIVALVAAGAEMWRFALLLRGRTEVLGSGVVRASDRLVVIASGSAAVLAVGALLLCAAVLARYHAAAAQRAGRRPARSTADVMARLLVPGWSLYAAGPVVIEAFRVARSGPRRLAVAWWCAWVGNGLLAAVTVGMSLAGVRWGGTQLIANAVEMHIVLDLAAGVVAGLTVAVLVALRRAWVGPRRRRYDGWTVLPPRDAPLTQPIRALTEVSTGVDSSASTTSAT